MSKADELREALAQAVHKWDTWVVVEIAEDDRPAYEEAARSIAATICEVLDIEEGYITTLRSYGWDGTVSRLAALLEVANGTDGSDTLDARCTRPRPIAATPGLYRQEHERRLYAPPHSTRPAMNDHDHELLRQMQNVANTLYLTAHTHAPDSPRFHQWIAQANAVDEITSQWLASKRTHHESTGETPR